MAKVNAPLLGFGASGQIGQSHVYATWRGVKYARRYTIPANPQTAEQSATRNVFSGLNSVYKLAGPLIADVWTAFAQGKPITARNGFLGNNIGNLRGEVDMALFTFCQGARGGLPPSSAVATPGSQQLSIAITTPTPPTGWTLTSAIAACIREQDPATMPYATTHAIEDTSSPYVCVLTGLTPSVVWRFGAWLKWAKPDLSIAYSVAIVGSGTPTA